jgi:hypothetical protein
VRREDAGGQLAALARAHEQHPAFGQGTEGDPRELDGGRGDRHAAPADRRRRTRTAARADRVAHEAVEHRPGGALGPSQRVGAAQLAQDLRLADDHRVDPGRHLEDVTCRREAVVALDPRRQRGGRQSGAVPHRAQRRALGGDGVAGHEIELGAIAGREHERLVHGAAGDQAAHQRLGARRRKRESLAQGERRIPVRDADPQQRRHGADRGGRRACRHRQRSRDPLHDLAANRAGAE